LNKEIEVLKSMVTSPEVSGDEVDQVQNTMGKKINEKETLDAQIAEKLAMLDAVQSDLDRSMGGGSSTMMTIFVSLLGALVLVLVVVLVIMMMGNKQKQQQLPPPWMYPPRPRKKKSKTETVKTQAQPTPTPTPAPVEDTAVLQSEVSDMKQAVVSMSVGQPNTATRIVKEWMEDDTPPPEPEPVAPVQAEEEENGGKKKKKKK
jgi:flagellar basal body-associated protein FliL